MAEAEREGSDADRSSNRTESTQQRAKFSTFELATVLSNYDIGVIDAIQDFPRGSRKAPKLLIKTDTGLYLLKRRPPSREDTRKVAFCHELQVDLARKQFPLPHLIGTKRDGSTMLRLENHIYELFEYIQGSAFDGSEDEIRDSGRILGLFHKLLAEHEPQNYDPPEISYHANRTVYAALERLPQTLAKLAEDEAQKREANQLSAYLAQQYREAAEAVEDAGLERWPKQIVHSDWHPGNMLYRSGRVVGVIDYDTARIYQRIIDIANGALQFSDQRTGADPTQWPDGIDETRFRTFIAGYEGVPNCVLSKAEIRVMPLLMIEAKIAEAVVPVANTGKFASLGGLTYLQTAKRKVAWLREHADELRGALEGS